MLLIIFVLIILVITFFIRCYYENEIFNHEKNAYKHYFELLQDASKRLREYEIDNNKEYMDFTQKEIDKLRAMNEKYLELKSYLRSGQLSERYGIAECWFWYMLTERMYKLSLDTLADAEDISGSLQIKEEWAKKLDDWYTYLKKRSIKK